MPEYVLGEKARACWLTLRPEYPVRRHSTHTHIHRHIHIHIHTCEYPVRRARAREASARMHPTRLLVREACDPCGLDMCVRTAM